MKDATHLRSMAQDRSVDVRHDFLLALKRLEEGRPERIKIRPRQKITPAMLAREADRARSQLYATHKDVLQKIEEVNVARDIRVQTEKKVQRKEAEELHAIISELTRDKDLLAQHNYRLQRRVQELEGGDPPEMASVTRLKPKTAAKNSKKRAEPLKPSAQRPRGRS